jgi:hypothetical protein
MQEKKNFLLTKCEEFCCFPLKTTLCRWFKETDAEKLTCQNERRLPVTDGKNHPFISLSILCVLVKVCLYLVFETTAKDHGKICIFLFYSCSMLLEDICRKFLSHVIF